MTRFWLTLTQGVHFVLRSIQEMQGGEVFVPKIPSMKVTDLSEAIAPGCRVINVGIRPGEKLHETLVSEDEARHCTELDDRFIIAPTHPWWKGHGEIAGSRMPDGFRYSSDTNPQWLTVNELRNLLGEFPVDEEKERAGLSGI